jgi:hypothetical protein
MSVVSWYPCFLKNERVQKAMADIRNREVIAMIKLSVELGATVGIGVKQGG